MNKKLQAALDQIDERLLKGDITNFKIGKTRNAEERFVAEDYDDYALASIIAFSKNAKEIDMAEKDLIDYYKKHKILSEKCENENLGGGNPDATYVYIIAKSLNADYVDRLIGKKPVLSKDFVPIEL